MASRKEDQSTVANRKALALALMSIVLIVLTQSPCLAAGLLKPVNGNDSDLFLKSHHVDVTINNGFARTEVDQVFTNTTSRDLEAIYSFPLPKKASLSELSLWINGKEVMGEVMEKQKARQIYDAEVGRKIDPALAEKNEHKTFDISVYPVVANDDTRLRLVYYQPIEIDSNIGRYLYPLTEMGEDNDTQAFWSIDDSVSESFKFNLELKSAFPVKDVRVPDYQDKAQITHVQQGMEENGNFTGDVFNVKIEPGTSLSKDIVVYYRLDGTAPARMELIPYRKDKKSPGTFMVVVTPAADLEMISEGSDWVFVLDTSGSMRGKNIATLIDGVAQTMGKLSGNDRFRIITFSDNARDITNGYLEATEENVGKYIEKLSSIKPGGSTRLYAGLMDAYKGMDENRTTAVILATDGDVKLNSQSHGDFLRLLEEFDVRVFSFIIGNGGNQPLMEQIAKDSGGFAMNVSDSDDIIGRILQAKSHILFENMHDVELEIRGGDVQDLTPGYIGNIYQGQQLVIFGQYQKSGPIELELKAKISGQPRSWICTAELPEVDTDNPELERMWALSNIEDIMQEIRDEGETEGLRSKVVDLGTEYSLVTDYTSMIVLTEERFKQLNIDRKNLRRVQTERQAQQQRKTAPVKNYRVDTTVDSNGNKGMFQGKRSPGIGTGPVGPAFIALALLLKRKKRQA